MENVVQATVYLSDIADFAAMNKVYATYFTEDCPARAAFQVAALPRGAKVEIAVIAVKEGLLPMLISRKMKRAELSDAQNQIDEIDAISQKDLAEKTFTSPATIIRFVRKIGYNNSGRDKRPVLK